MIIKVCGLKYNENILAIQSCQPDWVGMIYYPQSKRHIDTATIDNTIKNSKTTSKVGVFVNADYDKIIEIANDLGLTHIQLHGEESPELCSLLKSQFTIIKAIPIKDTINNNELNKYINHIDYFLFDTQGKKKGGNGISFDWNILKEYHLDKPFILAGGISINNINEIKKIQHPQFKGVDINSKFEIEAGLKDVQLVEQFIKELRIYAKNSN